MFNRSEYHLLLLLLGFYISASPVDRGASQYYNIKMLQYIHKTFRIQLFEYM
jgi:hypothetical protein